MAAIAGMCSARGCECASACKLCAYMRPPAIAFSGELNDTAASCVRVECIKTWICDGQ